MPALHAASGLTMVATDAAWLAGFFDGEGGVYRYRSGGGTTCWCIQIPNTHLPSVEHCRAITGVGNIQSKPVQGTRRRPQWCWRVTRKMDIIDLCEQMLPFLVTKAESVRSFLAEVA